MQIVACFCSIEQLGRHYRYFFALNKVLTISEKLSHTNNVHKQNLRQTCSPIYAITDIKYI